MKARATKDRKEYAGLNPPLPLGNDEAGYAFVSEIPRRYKDQISFLVKRHRERYASRLRKGE